MNRAWRHHVWTNRVQTAFLVALLFALLASVGALLFGEAGLLAASVLVIGVLGLAPEASGRLTLRLYRAQAILPAAAPGLSAMARTLAARAGLPAPPRLYYVPSPATNAFAVGTPEAAAIALSDGLLRRLAPRELAGVLAHEIAHIAHGDLRVMGFADMISRLTHLGALAGCIAILLALPPYLAGTVTINLPALALLVLAPQVALLAQLGLSRVREFDADLRAAALTGDPLGLAAALERIDRAARGWRALVMPGLGNPEPSWLRTHPETHERIRRLRELRPGNAPFAVPQWHAGWLPAPPPRRRWRIGGLWY